MLAVSEQPQSHRSQLAEAEARVSRSRQAWMEAENALARLKATGSRSKAFSFHEIERRAVHLFGYTTQQLRGAMRNERTSFARQFVMYWSLRLTGLTLSEVGRLLGNRDHATIHYGAAKYVEKRKAKNRHLRPAR